MTHSTLGARKVMEKGNKVTAKLLIQLVLGAFRVSIPCTLCLLRCDWIKEPDLDKPWCFHVY